MGIEYRESRELRNKRIAIEAITLLRRASLGEMSHEEVAVDAEDFYRRWEDRGVVWVRPGPATVHPDDWVTANEMAAEADMSAAAVRRLCYRGRISSITADDGTPLYNVGEVLRYRAARDVYRPGYDCR